MRKFAAFAALGVSLTAAALLIIDSSSAVRGASEALTLCSGVLIPSMFPFMTICCFIADFNVPERIGRWVSPVMRVLFRQPAAAFPVVVFGLIGGYPVGARMAQSLLERGEITKEQAQRLTLFCVNAGPAFVIGTVGASQLSSQRAGALLFASLCIASLLLGVLTRFMPDADSALPENKIRSAPPIATSLVNAVSSGAAGILAVCSWVVFFGSICALIPQVPGKTAAICILEVTGGCLGAADCSLPIIASVLGFGGLCVHCQIFSLSEHIEIKPAFFFGARVLTAVFAAFICEGLTKLFPQAVTTLANSAEAITASSAASVPAICAMLFLCAIVILDLDTYEKVC